MHKLSAEKEVRNVFIAVRESEMAECENLFIFKLVGNANKAAKDIGQKGDGSISIRVLAPP